MSTTDNNNEQQCGNSGEMTLNKEKCTSCEQSNVDNITEGINSIAMDDKSTCANCGKKGDDVNNVCNKCKQVKYCNASCKKKHRHKHKKQCEEYVRLAAEHAAELHDIELFKQPPPPEDCPICFLRLPMINMSWRYMTCCGKRLCCGCSYAPVYDNQGNEVDNNKCAFCRTPDPTSYEEMIECEKKRVDLDDPIAIFNLGMYHCDGINGFTQNYTKALELWHRAAELGYTKAYFNIGYAYCEGEGVEVDKKKALHYFELAAMGGSIVARRDLGNNEKTAGNMERASRHYIIAARSGCTESLNSIKKLYTNGHATKEDYMKALQSYQIYLGEIKSDQRDAAAAAQENCRYY